MHTYTDGDTTWSHTNGRDGDMPFSNVNNIEMRRKIKRGLRLGQPDVSSATLSILPLPFSSSPPRGHRLPSPFMLRVNILPLLYRPV